ncbi:MAG TPA: hypothetical protein VF603_05270 [Allosphingosinicella sp.]|jgi:hypothetical protein
MKTSFRELTQAELEFVAGGDEPPMGYAPPIDVFGYRIRSLTAFGTGGFGYGWDTSTNDGGGGGYVEETTPAEPEPSPPDLNCLTPAQISALSPVERDAYFMSVEAAEIAREIMTKADRDTREYGSIIYRDSNGVITHTPVVPGGPTSVSPTSEGMANFGQFLGLVHSHTAATYIASMPNYKLFPTPGAGGDWPVFDWYTQQMYNSLISDHGMSVQQAADRVSNVRHFMVSPMGPMGSDLYGVFGYANHDRDSFTPGQRVNINLGLCDSSGGSTGSSGTGGTTSPPRPWAAGLLTETRE